MRSRAGLEVAQLFLSFLSLLYLAHGGFLQTKVRGLTLKRDGAVWADGIQSNGPCVPASGETAANVFQPSCTIYESNSSYRMEAQSDIIGTVATLSRLTVTGWRSVEGSGLAFAATQFSGPSCHLTGVHLGTMKEVWSAIGTCGRCLEEPAVRWAKQPSAPRRTASRLRLSSSQDTAAEQPCILEVVTHSECEAVVYLVDACELDRMAHASAEVGDLPVEARPDRAMAFPASLQLSRRGLSTGTRWLDDAQLGFRALFARDGDSELSPQPECTTPAIAVVVVAGPLQSDMRVDWSLELNGQHDGYPGICSNHHNDDDHGESADGIQGAAGTRRLQNPGSQPIRSPVNSPTSKFMLVGVKGLEIMMVNRSVAYKPEESSASASSATSAGSIAVASPAWEQVIVLVLSIVLRMDGAKAHNFHRTAGVWGTLNNIVALRSTNGAVLGEWLHRCMADDPVCQAFVRQLGFGQSLWIPNMQGINAVPGSDNSWSWGQGAAGGGYNQGLDVPIRRSAGFLCHLTGWPVSPDGDDGGLRVRGDVRYPGDSPGGLWDDQDDYPVQDDYIDDNTVFPLPSGTPFPTPAPTPWPTYVPDDLPLGHRCGGGPTWRLCSSVLIMFSMRFVALDRLEMRPEWTHSIRGPPPASVTIVPGRHLPWPGQEAGNSVAGIHIRSSAISGSFDDDVDGAPGAGDVGLPMCQSAMLRASDGAIVWQDATACFAGWNQGPFSALVYGPYQSEVLVVPGGSSTQGLEHPGPAWLLGMHSDTTGGPYGVTAAVPVITVRDAATGRVVLNQRLRLPEAARTDDEDDDSGNGRLAVVGGGWGQGGGSDDAPEVAVTMPGYMRSLFPVPCESTGGSESELTRSARPLACIVVGLVMPRDSERVKFARLRAVTGGQGTRPLLEMESPGLVPSAWPSPGWFAPAVSYSSAPTQSAALPTGSPIESVGVQPWAVFAGLVLTGCVVLGAVALVLVWWRGECSVCRGGLATGQSYHRMEGRLELTSVGKGQEGIWERNEEGRAVEEGRKDQSSGENDPAGANGDQEGLSGDQEGLSDIIGFAGDRLDPSDAAVEQGAMAGSWTSPIGVSGRVQVQVGASGFEGSMQPASVELAPVRGLGAST